MITQIKIGQVKQIALEVSKKYDLVNHGTHYNIINKKTRQSSNQGGDQNLTSYDFYCLIEFQYLKLINEKSQYFDWQMNGVGVTNDRRNYTFKIKEKVVEILCGYKF
jgi:hypothetical protein